MIVTTRGIQIIICYFTKSISRADVASYRFINHNPSGIICVTGDRQNITFSPGSGTQTASRFSSTSCRGSSYFSCCWPWWRPSLGRPPVPACRTSTGTPPIQCKSAPYFCFFFFRLFAPHLFRVIIFYHAGHWDCVSLDLREDTVEKKIWGQDGIFKNLFNCRTLIMPLITHPAIQRDSSICFERYLWESTQLPYIDNVINYTYNHSTWQLYLFWTTSLKTRSLEAIVTKWLDRLKETEKYTDNRMKVKRGIGGRFSKCPIFDLYRLPTIINASVSRFVSFGPFSLICDTSRCLPSINRLPQFASKA